MCETLVLMVVRVREEWVALIEAEDASMDDLEALARRSGLDLTPEEVESLRPMYEHFAAEAAKMHEVDLDDGDLAVMFTPAELE